MYLILLPVQDPFTGQFRNVAAAWTGKKWLLTSQDQPLNFISGREINSIISASGTNGTTIFPLFADSTSTTLRKVLRTKLWSGDTWLIVKQAMRAYLQAKDNSGAGYTFTGTIDFQNSSDSASPGAATSAISFGSSSPAIDWIGAGSATFQFTGAGGAALDFTSAGETASGLNANGAGCQIGATLQSTSPDFTVIAFALLYRNLAPLGG